MSIVWEDAHDCALQYMCALAIYLMNILLYLYGIILDLAINASGNGNNVVYVLNATDKCYLK